MNKMMRGNDGDGGDGDAGGDEAWKVLVVGDVLVLRRWGSRLCLLKSVSKAMAIMMATVTTTMEATVTATESPSWWLKAKGQNGAVWGQMQGTCRQGNLEDPVPYEYHTNPHPNVFGPFYYVS
ncbi:uncharacterized protein G2W53_009111 [Senna tora]|uniref:Uncharacterized protein n=1 Tax=Senna tora TaxID=362788 RepID=A0A834WXY0_9FABA|nr:uncharacterized protein G2W53_009111 [Senna tora]